jgi:hypothetical protein
LKRIISVQQSGTAVPVKEKGNSITAFSVDLEFQPRTVDLDFYFLAHIWFVTFSKLTQPLHILQLALEVYSTLEQNGDLPSAGFSGDKQTFYISQFVDTVTHTFNNGANHKPGSINGIRNQTTWPFLLNSA